MYNKNLTVFIPYFLEFLGCESSSDLESFNVFLLWLLKYI